MSDPAWISATAAALGGLSALVAASTGIRTLRQVRKDSEARSRPMVVTELRKPPHSRGIQSLVIKNAGPSIARNVRVRFEPEIPDPPPERAAESVVPFLKRRYAQPIPVLTPGMELANLYYVGRPGDGVRNENTEQTPNRVTVTITYDRPYKSRKPPFEEVFELDTSILRQETYVTSSTAPENQTKQAVKLLAKIHDAIVGLSGKEPA